MTSAPWRAADVDESYGRVRVMRDNLDAAPTEPLAIDMRENFIPVTQQGLRDRLTRPDCWTDGRHLDANKFFRYLNYWRRQKYSAHLHDLQQAYEPFSPDSDLLVTRQYSVSEAQALRARVIGDVRLLLKHANYTSVDPAQF